MEQLKAKLQEEQTQRIILNTLGVIAIFVAQRAIGGLMSNGLESGINALMTKLHPAIEEIPA